MSEIKQVWISYKKHKRDREQRKLVEYYFPYVQKISVKMAERLQWQIEASVLASFGVDGLYKAIEGFDLSKNIKFESYASRRIQGSMIDGLRKEDQIPRSVRIASDRFSKAKEQLQNDLGYRVDNVEVVTTLDIKEKNFQKNYKKYIVSTPVSIHNQLEADGCKEDHNNAFIDKKTKHPENNIARLEFFETLSSCLSEIEKKIVYYHYYKGYTMEKIATLIGKSESRVSQIHKNILKKLKAGLKKGSDSLDKCLANLP